MRKPGIKVPTNQLKIVFARGYHDSSDTGDLTNASSYEGFDYAKDINRIRNIRNTDIIDARPRVSDYTVTDLIRS